jgi:hypothetical protein
VHLIDVVRVADGSRVTIRPTLPQDAELLGPEHPDVGAALNNLATLYEKQGRYAEA